MLICSRPRHFALRSSSQYHARIHAYVGSALLMSNAIGMSDSQRLASLGAQVHTSCGGGKKSRVSVAADPRRRNRALEETNPFVPRATIMLAARILSPREKIRWVSCSRVGSDVRARVDPVLRDSEIEFSVITCTCIYVRARARARVLNNARWQM